MNHAFLLTGGNLGSRVENLASAKKGIEERIGRVVDESSLYETAAWGNENQPDFLNQVLLVDTNLSPTSLLETILQIEKGLGRIRAEKYDSRLIDIDILFYNCDHIQAADLVIPHPLLHNRRFVLEPLCEIVPDLVHPVLHQTMAQLLEQCTDPLCVKKFS